MFCIAALSLPGIVHAQHVAIFLLQEAKCPRKQIAIQSASEMGPGAVGGT